MSSFGVILDLTQDVFIYSLLSLGAGLIIEKLFTPEDVSKVHQRSTIELVILVILQLLFDAFAIYLIFMIVSNLPTASQLVGLNVPTEKRNVISNITSGIIISLIFLNAQPTLRRRIDEILQRFKL
jgi:hypothetical protein